MKYNRNAVFACLFCLTAFTANSFGADLSTEQRAVIKTMVGQVEVSSTNTAQWRSAHIGMVVKMGADIRTYVESTADIEIESGTIIKVGENTVVSLAKLLQNKKNDISNTSLKVATGTVWANVKKLTNTKSDFDFETPTAVASIRGTRLGVSVDMKGTAVDVYEGLVVVREKSTGKTVSVGTKTSAIVHADSKGIDLVDFSKKSSADSSKTKARTTDPFAADTSLTKTKTDSSTAKIKIDTAASTKKPDTLGMKFKADSTASATKFPADTSVKKQAALFLSVSAPKDGAVVADPMIAVLGTTTPGAKVIINNTPITVSPSGSFSYTVPIPDEAHDYAIRIIARLADNEASEERTVTYVPAKSPLTLSVSFPVDGQLIRDNVLQVVGKTSPRATVTVNGRPAVVSPQGNISCGIQLTERDIGDYELDIAATGDDNKEMTKTIRTSVDVSSPQINSSVPILVMQEQGLQATRIGKLTVDVIDRTPEDQITLTFQNNGRSENITMNPGERQYLNLDEGKNSYSVKAYDKARNVSNVVQGVIYFLPGQLLIQFREPVDNPLVITDMPPMPRNVPLSQQRVEVEIEDGIGNVPESIKYCRLIGDGVTLQMTGNNNYRYYANVALSRGSHSYTVQVEDLCGNLMSKRLDILVKQ
jgi:hypothetical protein